jgi:EmrB/QacA subfamily drug resistance transporter
MASPSVSSTESTEDSASGRTQEAVPARIHSGLTLAVVCAAVFMLLLDVTVVSVALADVQRDLGASLADLQWVVDAYTLTLAGGLLTAATLGDRIGRRQIFVWGLAVFTAASLACALAGSADLLDGARAVQGLGAALLFGAAMPLIGDAFPDAGRRARAIGVLGAGMSAATAVGPLVGGALVDGPGWRWIFFINVPVGVLTLVAGLRLRESRPAVARRADWPGTALLTASLLTLLLALIRGNGDGWSSPRIVGLFVASGVLLAAFVGRELRAAEPMLDLGLFTRPRFTGVALQAFASAATLVAASYFLAIYLQNSLGFTPFQTGLRVLPLSLAAFVAAPVSAALLHRVGASVSLVVSLVLIGGGLLLAARIDAGSAWTVLVPGFVVAGLGLGAGMASGTSAALAVVEPARAGMATGAVNTMRQIGTAAGVAVLGAAFEHRATTSAADLLAAAPHLAAAPSATRDRIVEAIGSGIGLRVVEAVPEPVRPTVAAIARHASTDALDLVLVTAGAAALVAAVACAVLLRLGAGRRS